MMKSMLAGLCAIVLSSSILSGNVETGQLAADHRMDWWREARFGLFIHWGLYSIPAGKWGSQTGHGEWIRETAQIPVGEYEKLRTQFNPVKFDAISIVRMAKDAGMKYIVITTKHHDGFCLFDSKYTDWDVMSTPFHRDIMKELAAACRQQGMKMCWYHSIMDWHHPDYLPRRGWEEATRPAAGADMDRYETYLHNQVTELLTNYGDIGVMWFDGEWESTWNHDRGKALYDLCRKLQPNVIVNNRVDVGRAGLEGFSEGGRRGDFGTPEQTIPDTGIPGTDWETCMTMNDHWGYNAYDTDYKSTKQLIQMLCDIASKGGNFLLNIGPTAEGEFPKAAQERLLDLGRWMSVNGDSIYGTTAGPFSKLPWGRCTVQTNAAGTKMYFHVFDWPKTGELVIPGLGNEVRKAYPLANMNQNLLVDRRDSDLVIHLPSKATDEIASVIVVEVAGEPIVYHAPEITAVSEEFVKPTQVEIKSGSPSIEVKYTTDGSNPERNSLTYRAPIKLVKSATIKARAFHNGKPVSAMAEKRFVKVEPWPSIANAVGTPGLKRESYLGSWDKLPEFNKMKSASEDTSSEIGLGVYSGKEYVGLRFSGMVSIPADDVYMFALGSDDGSRLSVDGRVVVDHDGLHSMEFKQGFAPLKSGKHHLVVEWFNKTGGAEIQLSWMQVSMGGKPKAVPASALSH